MQIAKTVTDITYNPTLQDSPLSHWRHRKFVGITYGSDECFYCISDYDGKGTVMVFNQTSNTFCARYRLKIDGVPSFVISRSPNYFWILMEEDRGRSRKNIRMYSIQMDDRFLVGVVPSNYRQSVRGSYRAMATDEDVLLVFHGSNPVLMDIWQTSDQRTIKLMDVRFENFMPVFTNGDSLFAFHGNNNGQCDCSMIYEIDFSNSTEYPKKTELACAGVEIPTGLKDRQTMLLTNSVAYVCGTNRNTGECSFWKVDNLREELSEGVRAYRRLDAADNSIQNAPLREKISWKAMIREAVKADPRKKATLREINCFVRKTFQMPPTFTKECVLRKIQANVVRGIADGTFTMTQGCGLKRHLRLV